MSDTAPDPAWIDAGHGVSFWVRAERHRLYYRHDCPMFGRNPLPIAFDVPENDWIPADGKWQVESLDPVTVSPSLLCPCGHHGFLRNGRWEPC